MTAGSDVWSPVVAALGSSALTGGFTWGVSARAQMRAERRAAEHARNDAYLGLLQACTAVFVLAQGLQTTVRFHTGMRGDMNVRLRYWRPLDPLELHDRFAASIGPVLDAQLVVWTFGSQAAIGAADTVVNAATAYLDAATDTSPTTSRATRWRAWQPSPEQVHELGERLRVLSRARADFVHQIRRELGHDQVMLAIDLKITRAS
ncbi:MAG: hypothetical protein ACYCYA_05850 [Actinomycetes bacterium]